MFGEIKIKMSKAKKVKELEELVHNLELELKKTKVILSELGGRDGKDAVDFSLKASEVGNEGVDETGLVIEGVFNGQIMIGPDGKQYSVPANYISKSKLVEGDILKLTIDQKGSFIFKQIGPVERIRIVGHLVKDKQSDEYLVLTGDKVYRVIIASITYFKGEEGDEVVILVPKDADSTWAAVENIIKKRNIENNSSEDFDLEL